MERERLDGDRLGVASDGNVQRRLLTGPNGCSRLKAGVLFSIFPATRIIEVCRN